MVACYGEEIAPCFSAAHRFRLWSFESDSTSNYCDLECSAEGGFERLRMIRERQVDVVICNGIEEWLRLMLEAEGCVVVAWVTGPALDALFGYLAGRLKPVQGKINGSAIQPHTADLARWTGDMLTSLGWQVTPLSEEENYPVDLNATHKCPICAKAVKLAVCCGAHAWQVDAELQEFSRVSRGAFQARLYVHHVLPGLEERCREFNIELLAPQAFAMLKPAQPGSSLLPPLKGGIEGHPKLNPSESRIEQPL